MFFSLSSVKPFFVSFLEEETDRERDLIGFLCERYREGEREDLYHSCWSVTAFVLFSLVRAEKKKKKGGARIRRQHRFFFFLLLLCT